MSDRDALLQAFHIEPADLDANRAGRLGGAQRRNLLRSGTMNVAGALLVGLLLAAVLYGVARKPHAPIQWIMAAALFGVTLAVGLRYYRQTRAAVAEGRVECLAGPVQVASRGKSGWFLSVAGQSFRIPIRPWHIERGAAYRVYIAPRPRIIVAMELDVAVPPGGS